MWNLLFLFSGLLFLLLLMIIFFSKEKISSIENNIFKIILLANLFEYIIQIPLEYLFRFLKINGRLGIILAKAYSVNIFVVFTIFTIYTFAICIKKDNQNKYLKKYELSKYILIIYCFLCSIILIILPLQNYYNGVDSYSYGLCVDVLKILLGIYMAVWIIQLILNIKDLYQKKYMPIYTIVALIIANVIIQNYHPEVMIPTVVATFICYTMYFTIENPDVKMLEEMTILRDRADKANNAKSEFLSSMSHEIRTPLNAIVGFSESLKEDNLPEESMEKVEDIVMASNNLLEIVNGILDISKIEANKLEIIEKEYEIEEIWEELIILTKARIGDRGIDFRVNIDPTIPKVLYGDNTRLKQVILNILTNAAKYTKEGFVDFRVSSVINNDTVKLIISVEDSGIGIKEENLPRLFSKFDRLSVEKSLTIEGTGLGLAITKKLVELMGGKIVVQSVYGKGSKFTIFIDQKIISYEVQHQKETSEATTKVIDIKGSKVLLVDDNALNIKVASTLLKKYNLDIDSCTSGFECLEKINKGNQYDIILLDDMMPRMSGKETLAKLKQINGFNIPVIALTANAIEGMKEEYLKSGFNDYLSKPIEKKELERVLRTYLSKKSINDTNTTSTSQTTSIIADNITQRVNNTSEFELPSLKKKENKESTQENNNKGNVLVVDDNELNIKVAVNLIKNYVNKVDSVTSGSDCISKIIENNNYDLILMDDMMPDLDGPSTLDNLRDIEGFNIPVILLTANELDKAVEEKIDNHHFAGYLAKPIKKEELINILTKFIK